MPSSKRQSSSRQGHPIIPKPLPRPDPAPEADIPRYEPKHKDRSELQTVGEFIYKGLSQYREQIIALRNVADRLRPMEVYDDEDHKEATSSGPGLLGELGALGNILDENNRKLSEIISFLNAII